MATALKNTTRSAAPKKTAIKMYNKYINDLVSGKIIAGKNIIKAAQRHLSDLEKSKSKNYPYYFNEDYADAMINFVKCCKLSGNKFQGTYFPIQPFQSFYYAMVYGWLKKKDNIRRFRTVYWCTARKSAKSEMTAPECLYHLLNAKGKTQISIVATTFDQAKYIYDPSKYMARELMNDFEDARALLKITQYEIRNTDTTAYIRRLTADHSTNDGAGILFGVFDEYHAYKDDTMVGVVSTSQGTEDEPILKIVTTAGFNKDGPDFKFRKHCCNVLDGIIEDDRLFCAIFDMDEDDDWQDPKNWAKPNPMYGVTPTVDFMQSEFIKAKNEGGEKLVQFLTKNLNKYTDAASVWIEHDRYLKNAKNMDLEFLRNKRCVIGVDLASEHDTTAVTYLFPPQEGMDKFYYFTKYYCPASKFKAIRVDGVFYNDWAEYIDKTDGEVIDKNRIKKDILDYAQIFDIKLIGFDPHKAVDLMTELDHLGLPCGKVLQSAHILGGGNSLWKELVLSENRINYDENPVTYWQMGNIEMYTDGNGNQKILKANNKKENKVDGPVSVSNAFVAYLDFTKDDAPEKELTIEELGII